MTITYTRVGDYLLPNLIPPESPKVGRWGMLRHSYLRNYREGLYTGMLMKGTLNAHLEEIDRQANEMECTCKMKVDTHKSVGVYFFPWYSIRERM